jgi:hypothetical protein
MLSKLLLISDNKVGEEEGASLLLLLMLPSSFARVKKVSIFLSKFFLSNTSLGTGF